jgi:hypothetical protein
MSSAICDVQQRVPYRAKSKSLLEVSAHDLDHIFRSFLGGL